MTEEHPHYRLNGKRYEIAGHRSAAKFADLMKWQLNGQRAKWPRAMANAAHPPPPERVEGKALALTWIGHSTVLLQTAGLNILTDPFLSERASPVQWAGPKRVRAPGLAVKQLPPIDIILLSHNHFDHMDLPALKQIALRHRPRIVTPLGNGRYMQNAMAGLHIDELDWHGSLHSGDTRLTLTPALHWSKRGFSDTNQTLWGAFVIETAGGVIYFAGDTGYGEGNTFRGIRARFGTPRLSLLPIGAYEPRWFMKAHHMNPDDAAAAHIDLGSRTSIAIHHGTVQLTDEAIDAPAKALRVALAARNIDPAHFIVADIGQSIAIP